MELNTISFPIFPQNFIIKIQVLTIYFWCLMLLNQTIKSYFVQIIRANYNADA